MRILLIGKNGQLGRALIPVLEPLATVTACGREKLDLTDFNLIESVIADTDPDLIINAAAHTEVDACESEPEPAVRINALAPGVIGMAARKRQATVIHFSTDYVFDGRQKAPYEETAPTAPLNRYGESKLAGEWALRTSGASSLIIRLSWLYGATGKNFFNTMLRLGQEHAELRVVDDQIGAPTPVHVVAQGVAAILRQQQEVEAFRFESGELLHFSCTECTSWHRFAEHIFDQAHNLGAPLRVERVAPIPSSAYPTPARRPKQSRFNLDRLAARFGVTPPSWKVGLRETLETKAAAETWQSVE